MANWIETSLRYDKMQENGAVKKVTEKFLVDALTVSEAEERTAKRMASFVSGIFFVSATKKTPITEIINPDAEWYYLAKLAFVTLDPKSGAEKKTVQQMLVGASDFDEAYRNLLKAMDGTVSDFELQSLALSPICDVFPYESSNE